MSCDQKLEIVWTPILVEADPETERPEQTFWQLNHGDRQVIVVGSEGTLYKNETGRKPLTFGHIDEDIKGPFGTRSHSS